MKPPKEIYNLKAKKKKVGEDGQEGDWRAEPLVSGTAINRYPLWTKSENRR
jgi:hypothetical protein